MSLISRISPRPEAILRIPDAIKRGLNVTAFIKELGKLGLTYRNTTMLADWRTVSQMEAKKDAIKYVRKDRYPTVKEYIESEWEWKEEWAYIIKCYVRLRPDEPIYTRTIDIESDRPLTPFEMEQQAWVRWGELKVTKEEDYPEELISVVPVAAMRRIKTEQF